MVFETGAPHASAPVDPASPVQGVRPREPQHAPSRRGHLRARAACGVANARNSCGYCSASRLAVHPDPQRPLTARCML